MGNRSQKAIVDIGRERVEEIIHALQDHEEVYIRGLGKFTARNIKARKGYLPHQKAFIDLPKTKRVVFQINRGLKGII